MSPHKSALLTDLALCVNHYRLLTPGIYVCVHAAVQLDRETRLVPGLVSMVNHGRLKQCNVSDIAFEGPPNFVLDVFDPGETSEYRKRRDILERFGVAEYVAVKNLPQPEMTWNRLVDGVFTEVLADENQLIKSQALPGLWISEPALRRRDWWTIISLIERGVTRLGHHEFQESIWHAGGRSGEPVEIPFEAG